MQPREAAKSIQVYLRVRPPVARELDGHATFDRLSIPEDRHDTVQLRLPVAGLPTSSFAFTKVFGPDSAQSALYDDFGARAVDAAFNGEHGVLIAYGQTGSGKTYTMSSLAQETLGIIPRAFRAVWDRIERDAAKTEFECTLSLVEIYREKIADLGNAEKPVVRYHRLDDTAVRVASYAETMQRYREGFLRREVAATSMNARSSRSHLVMTLGILVKPKCGDGSASVGAPILDGKLIVCDLAGSERLIKTEATGEQRDEGIAINLSLLALGNAVSSLSTGQQFTQFREAVLTRVLQEALVGKGDTSILITVSPSDEHIKETWHAVEFGQRARGLRQNSKRHEIQNYRHLYQCALIDIDGLREQLAERDHVIKQLRERLREWENRQPAPVQAGLPLPAAAGAYSDDEGDETSSTLSFTSSSPSSSSYSEATAPSSAPMSGGARPGHERTAHRAQNAPSPALTVNGDSEGGEVADQFAGHGRAPDGAQPSRQEMEATINELRRDLEGSDEVIWELKLDVDRLEAVLQKERQMRMDLTIRYAETASHVSALHDTIVDIRAKSMSASPIRSARASVARAGETKEAAAANPQQQHRQNSSPPQQRQEQQQQQRCCAAM